MIRSFLAGIIVLLAAVVAVAGLFAGWIRTDLMDTELWTETSREVYQEEEVQAAVATWAIYEIDSRVDVEKQIAAILPKRSSFLAGPLAGQLKAESYDLALRGMKEPRVEEFWVSANRNAHTRFIRVIDGDDPVILANGPISINLRPLLEEIASRSKMSARVIENLPKTDVVITPPRSPELEKGIEVLRFLKKWGLWIGLLCFPLVGAAMLVIGKNRYRVWLWFGALLALGGIALPGVRDSLGLVVADLLTETVTWNKAVLSTWDAMTDSLVGLAFAMVCVGIAMATLAWITGPGQIAKSLRSVAAPLARVPALTSASVAVFIGIILCRSIDGLAQRSLITQLVLVALVAAWWLQFRKLSLREASAPAAAS